MNKNKENLNFLAFEWTNYINIFFIPVPDRVEDVTAALTQFKTEFSERYCQEKAGPIFSTTTFSDVMDEAINGPNLKPLGKMTNFKLVFAWNSVEKFNNN